MSYALQRIEDGKYVARQGSAHSYVRGIENARAFATIEEAKRGKTVRRSGWHQAAANHDYQSLLRFSFSYDSVVATDWVAV